jgi:hypothetical protein
MQPTRAQHQDITPRSAADVSDNAAGRNAGRQLIKPLGDLRCGDRVLPGELGRDQIVGPLGLSDLLLAASQGVPARLRHPASMYRWPAGPSLLMGGLTSDLPGATRALETYARGTSREPIDGKVLKAIARFLHHAIPGASEDGPEGSRFQPGYYSGPTGGAFLPVRDETTPDWERKDLGI